MKFRFLPVCWLVFASVAWADTIYKYVDDQGNVTYSNRPIRGAKVIVLDPAPPPAPPALNPDQAQPAPATPGGQRAAPAPGRPRQQATPANFPRVDNETQRKRDLARKQILEEELKNEEKALAEAKKSLKEGQETRLGSERNYQKYLDRVQGLKDTVTQHEKNVEALRKELGNLK